MEYILLIVAIVLLIGGLVGSVLPALPGLPVSWVGILCLYLISGVEMNYYILWASFIVMIAISILDYIIPAQGTKRFGGSKYGVWGTNIGLVLGIITPIPLGFLIGPFVGAFIGEIIYKSDDVQRAFKAAVGSFIGFLASTFIKVIASLVFIGLGMRIIWVNSKVWF
ncbi:DUF456 domain-containing protein [Myroides marinus]|uniref:DUF456 domain-containing protein n=1 Tax=Myroides marinus TaxID=703342 RepID=UPI002575900A|nr:DUF456 domain-containing protein [Myroides marinus]MDM1369869.1 DUF456 domain-containing protein [Myroides marinus]MDM1372528.1 DUF456 domain-containing protein [Myroides marinus]MDM1376814.1 DUF456 domain-containing protein [Myroides marinus]MDM1384133.1 DUF456 domain-containing protein [Myroides marinus]MDM1389466.1 DUF456 domain-containing protein [Myroides marinus]